MKAYLYINPKAPAEVKDLLAEHFSAPYSCRRSREASRRRASSV
jgi:hypothetical protein